MLSKSFNGNNVEMMPVKTYHIIHQYICRVEDACSKIRTSIESLCKECRILTDIMI